MAKATPTFPEELTDRELAYDIGKYTLKLVLRRTKDTSGAKLEKLKIKLAEDGASCTHIYKFTEPLTQHIFGVIASALEDVCKFKIAKFEATDTILTLVFSNEKIETTNDDE